MLESARCNLFHSDFHTQRASTADTACGVFQISLDSLTESRSSVVLSRITIWKRVIRQQSLPQKTSAGSNHHRHAQRSAAVFTANPALMALRLRCHAAGQPVCPASIQQQIGLRGEAGVGSLQRCETMPNSGLLSLPIDWHWQYIASHKTFRRKNSSG